MFGGGGFWAAGSSWGRGLTQSAGVSSQILRGGAFIGLQDTVRIVTDDMNNSLIVQASAADYAYIAEIIRKLDVLPRQAIIDARIFEVDLTDAFTFGVAAQLQAKSGEHLTTGATFGSWRPFREHLRVHRERPGDSASDRCPAAEDEGKNSRSAIRAGSGRYGCPHHRRW